MQIQPIDITQIIVAIITAAGVIYSARQQRKQQEKREQEVAPRKISTWTIVMCLSLFLLAANLGVFGLRYWGPTTDIEITYPYDGATVEIREIVRGTSEKIPEGQAIWIVVYPHIVGRYYPQNDPADVHADGDWASLTFIGIEEDVGRKFDIIAVLADESAQEAFNVYLTQAKDKKTWQGLEKLPEGTAIYDRITVTRKST
jgi:hypothetical protein